MLLFLISGTMKISYLHCLSTTVLLSWGTTASMSCSKLYLVSKGWYVVCARAVEAHGERVRLQVRVLAGLVFAYLGLPFLAPEICIKVTIARQNWLLVCQGRISE